MSERAKIRWLLGLLILSSALGIIRAPLERRAGRAEQKRWSDEWYAAHKDIRIEFETVILHADGSVISCHSNTLPDSFAVSLTKCEETVSAPPAPTPSRKGKRHVYELPSSCSYDDSRISCYPPTVLKFRDAKGLVTVCTNGEFVDGKCEAAPKQEPAPSMKFEWRSGGYWIQENGGEWRPMGAGGGPSMNCSSWIETQPASAEAPKPQPEVRPAP